MHFAYFECHLIDFEIISMAAAAPGSETAGAAWLLPTTLWREVLAHGTWSCLNVLEGTVTTCVTATMHYDVFAQSQGCSLPNRTWHYNCTQVQLEMCLDSNLCTVMRGNDLGSISACKLSSRSNPNLGLLALCSLKLKASIIRHNHTQHQPCPLWPSHLWVNLWKTGKTGIPLKCKTK